jgi:hypothetical protein
MQTIPLVDSEQSCHSDLLALDGFTILREPPCEREGFILPTFPIHVAEGSFLLMSLTVYPKQIEGTSGRSFGYADLRAVDTD